jgi:hypothetical protein
MDSALFYVFCIKFAVDSVSGSFEMADSFLLAVGRSLKFVKPHSFEIHTVPFHEHRTEFYESWLLYSEVIKSI